MKDDKKKNYLNLIGLPDIASIGNLILGFIGIVFLFNGYRLLFIKSILFAGLLDGIDGIIARKRYEGGSSSFGVEIDSLADLVSFGLAPALFFWTSTDLNTIYLVIPSLFLAISMLRLARYNISEQKHGFLGVPTTCAGLILIILLSIELPRYEVLMVLSSLLLSFLMISPFHFPKFRTKFLLPIGFLLVFLVSSSGILFFYGKIILLILLITYIITGPVLKWNYLEMN